MLLFNLRLLWDDPLLFFLLLGTVALALLIAITVHEFSHALAADRLGDSTARRLGRLSLNPLAHLDPVGTLMLFLVGFGWGKPVPVNPYLLRREPRKAMALVSFSGPLANVVAAGLVAIPIRLGLVSWPFTSSLSYHGGISWVSTILGFIIFYNLILAVFNLIPIAPLDGFKVAVGVLPRNWAYSYARLEQYGPMILLLFIVFSYATGFLWYILSHGVNFLAHLLVG